MTPVFLMVAAAGTIAAAPPGWGPATLREGEVVLLADDGGLEAIAAAARALEQPAVSLLRSETDATEQERTVIDFAQTLPLIWVGAAFSERARRWAHDRGPMTLLLEASGGLDDDQRARIGRFVTLLSRQTD